MMIHMRWYRVCLVVLAVSPWYRVCHVTQGLTFIWCLGMSAYGYIGVTTRAQFVFNILAACLSVMLRCGDIQTVYQPCMRATV